MADEDDLEYPADISPEKICFIVVKAHEFDAKVSVVESDPGGNETDDDVREVLEDYADDATAIELRDAIEGLSDDEQVDLITLMWIGRGDFDANEFAEARAVVVHEYRRSTTPDYLMGTPLLGELLEEALSQYGRSCEEFELGHL